MLSRVAQSFRQRVCLTARFSASGSKYNRIKPQLLHRTMLTRSPVDKKGSQTEQRLASRQDFRHFGRIQLNAFAGDLTVRISKPIIFSNLPMNSPSTRPDSSVPVGAPEVLPAKAQ